MKPPIVPLLTLDQVRAKRLEIKDGERRLAEITEKLAKDREQFERMLPFVPEDQLEALLTEDDESEQSSVSESDRPPMPASESRVKATTKRGAGLDFGRLLIDIVRKSPSGISHSDLKSRVRLTEHAYRLEDEAKAYHRGVARLVDRGMIVRHAGLLFHKDVYQVLKKAGSLPPVEEGLSVRENSAAKIALEVLARYPQGLTGPQLKVLVGAHDGAPKSVTEHGQYIYNVLATLVGSGRVAKDGTHYRIAETATPR